MSANRIQISDNRMISASRLLPKEELEMDTVKGGKRKRNNGSKKVLLRAAQAWYDMEQFRKDRQRAKNYVYGKQWDDLIEVPGCGTMKEEDYIKSRGNIPLKNNHIRRLVQTMVGLYRSQDKEPTCVARDRDEQRLGEVMSTTLQANWQLNQMKEVNARTFEDYVIGGMAVHKKTYSFRNDRSDCWTDYVNPNNFFISKHTQDFRGWDVDLLGEIHDLPFNVLCNNFASSPEDYRILKSIYSPDEYGVYQGWGGDFGQSNILDYKDFLLPRSPGLCRVIEVWTKESKPRYKCHDVLKGQYYKVEVSDFQSLVLNENERRKKLAVEQGIGDDVPLIRYDWFIDTYWYVRYMTPFGDVLLEMETPYLHKSHPYIFKMYPYIDGEIHSFVSDVIDQQRYVNRLISMYDWIMRGSAKGLLLVPEESIPEGMDISDFAESWASMDGAIMVKTKNGTPLPQQVSTNAVNIGIAELLNLQLKFFEDISGVNGAIQGKAGYSGMAASLYAQQTQNATTSLLDILETYSNFIVNGAMKDVMNIQQFYDDKRYIKIAGSSTGIYYDPNQLADVEFDLSIVESTTTPVYRQMQNELLLTMWQNGGITIKQMLEHGSFPFADELIQSINTQEEEMKSQMNKQGAVQANGIPPEVMQQVQATADQGAVNKAYGMLRN